MSISWEQPPLDSPLYGNRQYSFRADLLTLDGEVEDELEWSDGGRAGLLPGGSLDLSADTDTRESARLSIVRDIRRERNWAQYRVRLWYTGEGVDDPEPLATLMPTAAPMRFPRWGYVSEELELHSLLAILVRSTMGSTYGVDEGDVVTDKIREILEGAGFTSGDYEIVHNESKVVATARTWDINTTRLSIINELLAGIGYWSAFTDAMGIIHIEPYVPLDARPIMWDFDDGALTGLYMPDWSMERDLLVPNKITVTQRVEGIWDPLPPAVATLPPEHPLSYENIGYWNERVVLDEDFVDQESGYLIALRYLGQGVPFEARTFRHPWLPGLRPNVKVRHIQTGVPELIGPIQSQTITIATDGLVETRVTRSAL